MASKSRSFEHHHYFAGRRPSADQVHDVLKLTRYGHHAPTRRPSFPHGSCVVYLRRRMHSHLGAARNTVSSPTAMLPSRTATNSGRPPRSVIAVSAGFLVLALYLYFSVNVQSIHSWLKLPSLLTSSVAPPSRHSMCPQLEPLLPITHANLSSALDNYLSSDAGANWTIDSLSLAVRIP